MPPQTILHSTDVWRGAESARSRVGTDDPRNPIAGDPFVYGSTSEYGQYNHADGGSNWLKMDGSVQSYNLKPWATASSGTKVLYLAMKQ